MAHGLTKFVAQDLIDNAEGATKLIDAAFEHGKEATTDALMEAVRAALKNQIEIARTLELIKQEFDKFEKAIDAIL